MNEAASKILTAPFAERFRREELGAFLQKHAMRSKGSAVNLVRAYRLAISRLHKHLAAATDAKGQPDPVLRPFADHLATDLITATARFSGRMGARKRTGGVGCFNCLPPAGVLWSR